MSREITKKPLRKEKYMFNVVLGLNSIRLINYIGILCKFMRENFNNFSLLTH